MDVSEITKVASRKRLNVDAEKLREKVSRETAKIIKLKVAQDTAYWDLKEKLQQVEGNHERLQQNMVEVQMQHEAISGQYQDELRLRPDTLNKLDSTREICDVLEEYGERLRDTLARCKSDQSSLCEAYKKSGELVRGMKQHHEMNDEKNKQLIKNLQEKVLSSNAHQTQLVQFLTAAKQQTDAELSSARKELADTAGENHKLSAAMCELARQIDLFKQELQMKDETISNIQTEKKQFLEEFSNRNHELKNTIHNKDKELKEALDAITSLRGAVSNQEEFAVGLREQNAQLQEQLAGLEDQLQAAQDALEEKEINVQRTNKENEEMKVFIAKLTDSGAQLENILTEKNQALQKATSEVKDLTWKLSTMESERNDLLSQLTELKDQRENMVSQIAELRGCCERLQAELEESRTAYNALKQESENKIKDLAFANVEMEKELDSKASTIAQLMSEIGTAGETAARLEASLHKYKLDSELERQAVKEKEIQQMRQLENVQMQVAAKENELAKQMTLLLDMRGEKERLQDKIQGMQNKIDNIQKELSEPQPRPPAGEAPELDDNALAFAPTPRAPPRGNTKPQNTMKSPLKPQKRHKHADSGKLDNMLFSIFSDNSMDGDSNMIDRHEVNRRFEALTRGEPVPPASMNTLKRRKAPSGGLRTIEEEDMSLSQIKKNMKNDEPRKFFKNVRAAVAKK